MRKLYRLFLTVLCCALVLPIVACGNSDSSTNVGSNETTDSANTFDLSQYKIVRSARISSKALDALTTFRDAINYYIGSKLETSSDYIKEGESVDDSSFEILIGSTNRAASSAAKDALDSAANGENYVIHFDGYKIAIVASDNDALILAMRAFIVDYVADAQFSDKMAQPFTSLGTADTNTQVLSSFAEVEISMVSTVEKDGNRWPTYGRVLELKYNGTNNGVLFATSQWAGQSFPVYRSDDGGNSWKLISEVKEQINTSLIGNWQPHIYELPCDVGDMPAGTLLLAGCSHDSNNSKTMQISIWRSYDLGVTWEQYTIVDTGNGLSDGMYEPFLICSEDGELVCFYSDETEVSSSGGQRLVFRVSSDGKNWGEKKNCVAPENESLRPGMVSVAKMGNHGYLIVYEMIGLTLGPVYYKVSENLTEWEDAESLGTQLTTSNRDFTGCTPYCEWTPEGGPYGTVIAAGRYGDANDGTVSSDLFVSFDLGKTWEVIENPLEFDYAQSSSANYAYSFGFFTGADGCVYYINNVFPDRAAYKYSYSSLKIAVIRFNGYTSYKYE